MRIAGKKVLITGASRGLGWALAFGCAAAGAARVLAGARRKEDLDALRRPAGRAGDRIDPIRLDVTRDDDIQEAAARGPIDIMINNAGVAVFGGVFKGKMEEFRREIEVNYFGVIRMVRALAPGMQEKGGGLIVNIGSMLGKVNLPALGTYCATKAALLSLAQAIRADLSSSNIRVITVMPGTLDTDMSRGFDVPKIDPEEAVGEILQAIENEPHECAIGDEARGVFNRLAENRRQVEESFAKFRA